MHHGSCQCGAVRFQVDGALPEPDACHCTQCRKQSGHYFVSTDVPRAALTVHGSEHITWYSKGGETPLMLPPGDGDQNKCSATEKVRRGFCSTCGSSLFWDAPRADWIGIAMGAFDPPTNTRVHMHIFTAEKGDYYEIADGLPQHQRTPL